jgi:hypothetical protein
MIMVLLSTAVILACTSGCGGGTAPQDEEPYTSNDNGNEIPLQTLAEGLTSDYGRIDEIPMPEDATPECLAIGGKEEFQRFLSLAYFQDPIAEVDFERYIVIAAMQGPKNTAGYSISISGAFQNGYEVKVVVLTTEPEPGAMTAQVLTSPYHLVLAERSAFDPRGELTFTFVDPENQLISQQFAGV